MQNLLFICSQNKLRSPSAEVIFGKMEGLSVRSAGLNHDSEQIISKEDVEWADTIFVMENVHRNKLRKKFKTSLKNQRVIVLEIQDEYEFMEPSLIDLLKKKVSPYLRFEYSDLKKEFSP